MQKMAMILPLIVSGCAIAMPTSGDALCDGTRDERAEHAAALAETPDERALATGTALIAKIDAGCAS